MKKFLFVLLVAVMSLTATSLYATAQETATMQAILTAVAQAHETETAVANFYETNSATFTPSITPTFTITETSSISPTFTITRTATINLTTVINATRTQVAANKTATAGAIYTKTFTPTATKTITKTMTPTVTKTATKTISATFTITPTYTATPTATPTSTPTPISYIVDTGKIKVYQLRQGAAGAEVISTHKCKLIKVVIDAAPCDVAGQSLNMYSASATNGLTATAYRFPIPVLDCVDVPKDINYGQLNDNAEPMTYRYFDSGMTVSKTAATIQAAFYFIEE